MERGVERRVVRQIADRERYPGDLRDPAIRLPLRILVQDRWAG